MKKLLFVLMCQLSVAPCQAKTIYVDVNGPDDPRTGSYEDPFRAFKRMMVVRTSNTSLYGKISRRFEKAVAVRIGRVGKQ